MRLRGFILEEYIRSADEQICDKHVVIFFHILSKARHSKVPQYIVCERH